MGHSSVTEYGIAGVFWKSIPDRLEAPIAIAHPDFRNDLNRQALEAGLIRGFIFVRRAMR